MQKALAFALAAAWAGIGVAQSADRPRPIDPGAKVPPVEYRSAFDGYRRFGDQELADWRKANDSVGRAGTKPRPEEKKQ